jgi:hypothetical protein
MSFEDEAHEWPAYDGLGDPELGDLPVHEGDEEDGDYSLLEKNLCEQPSGLDYYDQFVQQALFWLHEELETEACLEQLQNLRAALKQDYGPKLRPVLGRPLVRLEQALDDEQPDLVIQLLIKLRDILLKRPDPNPKSPKGVLWSPKMLN